MLRLLLLPRVGWGGTGRQLAAAPISTSVSPKVKRGSVKKKGARRLRSPSASVRGRKFGDDEGDTRVKRQHTKQDEVPGGTRSTTSMSASGDREVPLTYRRLTVTNPLREAAEPSPLISSTTVSRDAGKGTVVAAAAPGLGNATAPSSRPSLSSHPPPASAAAALPRPSHPLPLGADGKIFTADQLQRRIRSILAQLVLLSPVPLQPSELFTLFTTAADAETVNMGDWAAYAADGFERGLFSRVPSSEKAMEAAAAAAAASAVLPTGASAAPKAERTASADAGDTAECRRMDGMESSQREKLATLGRQLSHAYRTGIVPMVAQMQAEAWAECAVRARNEHHLLLPTSRDVASWMVLAIVYTDAEFRVSSYSGAVCYPALPSLLASTVDPLTHRQLQTIAYTLQYERPPTSSAPLFSAWARTVTRATSPGPAARVDHAWLNAVGWAPAWTTAHAQLILYGILAHGQTRQDSNPAAEVDGATAHVSRPTAYASSSLPSSSRRSPVEIEVRKRVLRAEERRCTSGHPLVDLLLEHASPTCSAAWQQREEANTASTMELQDGAHTAQREKTRMRTVSVGTSPVEARSPSLGWNEGRGGTAVVRQLTEDLTAGGPYALLMHALAHSKDGGHSVYQINQRFVRRLFHYLVATPISVARLSTILRWNLSVPCAPLFSSFFYFLLLAGASPVVHRMSKESLQRHQANLLCSEMWGADGTERFHSPEEEKIRQALLAFDPTFTSAGHGDARGGTSDATAALHRTFIREAQVTQVTKDQGSLLVELMCVRVLPHARPGWATSLQQSGSKAAPTRTHASFLGYPLRFVEVLPTWCCAPEEILRYLQQQQQQRGDDLEEHWLEIHEEPYLLMFSMDGGTLERRIRVAAERLRRATTVATAGTESSPLRVSLAELGLITLWTHEYGAAMAAELLFVFLLPHRDKVRLRPPAPRPPPQQQQNGAESPVVDSAAYGEWSLEFLDAVPLSFSKEKERDFFECRREE